MTDSKQPSDANEDEAPASLRLTLIVCGAIILISGAIYWIIINTQPEAERSTETRETAMWVEITTAKLGDHRPQIKALGTVVPASEFEVSAQVEGLVVKRSPAFEPGGFIKAGETLLEIEADDYRNALAQRRSERDQAAADLALEMGRQKIAQADLGLLEDMADVPAEGDRALVLREPQLKTARARLQAAEARVAQAELDLSRTTITAPYDLQVLEREADVGTQVTPGERLGRVVGTNEYWITATVPLSTLQRIDIASRGVGEGSEVHLLHRGVWPEGSMRQGRVARLIGELNSTTRLARLLVVVEDPLAQNASDQPALMLGSVLHCTILGSEIPNVIRMDRGLIRTGGTVWIMDEDNKLRIVEPTVVFEDSQYVYISEGVEDGSKIVTTDLSSVTEGAPLRLEGNTK